MMLRMAAGVGCMAAMATATGQCCKETALAGASAGVLLLPCVCLLGDAVFGEP
jgi:hypothetical protein